MKNLWTISQDLITHIQIVWSIIQSIRAFIQRVFFSQSLWTIIQGAHFYSRDTIWLFNSNFIFSCVIEQVLNFSLLIITVFEFNQPRIWNNDF